MLHLNENYSNSTPIAVLGTFQSSEMDYKKICSNMFVHFKSMFTFAVLQSIIIYAYGIFYTHKGTILKKYRQAVSVYYGPWAIIGCSKLGYSPVFCYLTQIISFHATTE